MNLLDLDQVATFLAVLETGNFGTAAGHRGISQGAVSQQISKLESQLGAHLIIRSTRRCLPTSAGAEFARHARDLLRVSLRAQTAVGKRGAVLGASSNIGIYLIQPYLKEFAKKHAAVQPQVRIASNPEIAALLDSGELDVAAMEWWDDRPGYHAAVWRRENLVAIVAPDHPWASLRELPANLLECVPLLGGEPGTGTGRILAEYLSQKSLPPAQTLGSTEAVKQWVKAGLGVSVVLAGTVSDDVAAGTMCAIPLADRQPSKDLYAIWRRDLLPDNTARRFVDCLLGRMM